MDLLLFASHIFVKWMTLLNLSGEAPLCQYSIPGKVAVGILGVFATAIFGIPIG